MAQIKRKVTDNEPVSGKKLICFFQSASINEEGEINHITYLLKLRESDEVTDSVPPNNSEIYTGLYGLGEKKWILNGRKISSVTKLYLPSDTTDPNAITLKEYFRTKAINSFPGVAAADPMWEAFEGWLREMILIKQANGELPI